LLTEQRIVTGSVQNPSSLRTQMPLGSYAGLRPTIVQRDDDRASIIRVRAVVGVGSVRWSPTEQPARG